MLSNSCGLFLLIATFVVTLPKLISLTNYSFKKIYVKSTLTLIIYSDAIFTAKDILSTSTLPQTTNIDKVAKRNFLGSQTLTVLNSISSDNLLIHGQPNAEAF